MQFTLIVFIFFSQRITLIAPVTLPTKNTIIIFFNYFSYYILKIKIEVLFFSLVENKRNHFLYNSFKGNMIRQFIWI